MCLRFRFFLILVALHGSSVVTPGEPEPDPVELPRIPPREPASAIQSFQLAPGFRIELAACEPQVVDPVAIAFDEDGRLFVAEMRGYPERREQALGRIRLLEDRDRDGRYEHSTVFADNLKWPTGVVCWKGGVFVTASPDILYLGDHDQDGVAEDRRVIFTGFGEDLDPLNMQALVNNLQWGPDGRIYGSTAPNGGTVRLGSEKGGGMDLRGSDFSFDPETLVLRPESGTAQYGLTFDDFGRRYVCSNSRHLIAVMYSWPWNRTGGLPHPLVDIPVDGGAAEVYRISGVEPWRVVRTRWRVQGRVDGPVEGGGRAAGYFTSASGLTVYRGDAFDRDQHGTVFIGDVGSNLVHQKLIEFPQGRVRPVARRPDSLQKSEFLASSDNWFRPVQCANGPDGALYVVDMYRETIEHPWSIPESIKKHLDLYSGADRGRIWRVVPEDFKTTAPVERSRLTVDGLVKLLGSGNGWERDTAMRLLLERNEQDVAGLVAGLVEDRTGDVRARVQALRLMARLRPLKEEEVLQLWADEPSSEVRRQLVRMWREVDAGLLQSWARDGDHKVRYEAALRTLTPGTGVTAELLGQFLEKDWEDPWTRRVLLAAARIHGVLAEVVGREGHFVRAVKLLQDAGIAGDDPMARDLVVQAREKMKKGEPPGAERDSALWMLANHPETGAEDLLAWVVRGEAENSALPALLGRSASEWEGKALEQWEQIPVRARGGLLSRMSAATVLAAIEGKRLAASEVGFQQQQDLRSHGDEKLSERAVAIFGEEKTLTRDEATAHYRPALKLEGDGREGKILFGQRCALCHRSGQSGAGPGLATLRNKGAPMLLENLLLPDREVAPQYSLWEVHLQDGVMLAGVISEEDTRELTLWFADGTSRKVAREEITKLVNLNRSLMPTGLEGGLNLQEMANLLAYITDGGE
ncbi:MAG: c-type cytochrome [Roseibacillus sp.]|nr:c-type cytochrome [Roseibacillus sp.]